MSFCEEQKREVISAQYKNSCCKMALICGALAAKASVSDDGYVEMMTSSADAREFLSALASEIYNADVSVTSDKRGGRGKKIRFKSHSAEKFVSKIKNHNGLLYNPHCGMCKSAFLRGAFLVSGRVTDPQKQYALEFSFSEDSAEHFYSFLSDNGIELKRMCKDGREVLYTKNSAAIEDFFGLASMNSTAFSIMNSKIKSELRNDANRVANCETNNIDKAVNTAMRQVTLISALDSAGLLGALPEELAVTARLRLEYNSLSLSQLAAKFTPSISKPGLSHRLNKIEQIGKELLEKMNEQ